MCIRDSCETLLCAEICQLLSPASFYLGQLAEAVKGGLDSVMGCCAAEEGDIINTEFFIQDIATIQPYAVLSIDCLLYTSRCV